MGKKAILADLLHRLGVTRTVLAARHYLGHDLLILAYHRVLDMGEESCFPFDPELVSATPAEFSWQMDWLGRNTSPVSFQDVLDALDGRHRLPPRPAIVTFDDGFDDNYTQAFPVLKRTGIPATIFIASGYIGGGEIFWYDFIAHVIYHAPAGEFEITGLGLSLFLDDTIASRRRAAETVLEALKRIPDARRCEIVQSLRNTWVGRLPADERRLSRPMSWDQVREMSRAGIEFGSHSVSHPILANLDDASLTRELVDSKVVIERETGKPVQVLAYPVGQDFAYDGRVVQTAQAAGYRLAVSYISGVNRLRALDHYGLRRLHVERYTRRADFSAMLALPEIFA